MDYQDIKKLIDDMGESKIDSLDIEFPEGIKISMKKDKTIVREVVSQESSPVMQNINVNTNTENKKMVSEKEAEKLKVVTSPMVGTFYESSSPDKEAFVKVGDKVKKGDVLCVIEAMKLMNEIESEFEGEIIEICVKNEEMVEFGKPLFRLK